MSVVFLYTEFVAWPEGAAEYEPIKLIAGVDAVVPIESNVLV